MKLPFWHRDGPSRPHPTPDQRRKRWVRLLLLVPVLVGLLFVAVTGSDHSAAGEGSKRGGLLAALKDPLSLFAERSPGGRGPGALLSTKPNFTPHERVLSMVREHELPDPVFPGVDGPVTAVAPQSLASISDADPGDDPGSGDPAIGPASFAPFFPGAQPGYPAVFPGPAFTPAPPSDPIVSAVPEPATWAMLILGFFAVGVAVRRRGRRQAGQACMRLRRVSDA
jgi:PEP-CTERM motif